MLSIVTEVHEFRIIDDQKIWAGYKNNLLNRWSYELKDAEIWATDYGILGNMNKRKYSANEVTDYFASTADDIATNQTKPNLKSEETKTSLFG